MYGFSFYDMVRMDYTDAVLALEKNVIAEWMVGAYNGDGSLGRDGELKIQILRFEDRSDARLLRIGRRGDRYAVRVSAFTDALGTLRALLDRRVLHEIERLGEEATRESVTACLLAGGLRDISDLPMEV